MSAPTCKLCGCTVEIDRDDVSGYNDRYSHYATSAKCACVDEPVVIEDTEDHDEDGPCVNRPSEDDMLEALLEAAHEVRWWGGPQKRLAIMRRSAERRAAVRAAASVAAKKAA